MNIVLTCASLLSVYVSYYIGDLILKRFFQKYKTLEHHRQKYVVKNFIKGFYLSIFVLYASVILKDAIVYNKWYNNTIHTLGLLYCIPDLMGLLQVPKLHRNTIFHHITVCLLSTINMFNDYQTEYSIWRGIVIYAYISSLTGIVNHYLAYRLICDEEHYINRKKILAQAAYNVYASSLVINWSYQLYVVVRWIYKIVILFTHQTQTGIVQNLIQTILPTTVLFVYVGLLYFVIVDDIVLVKFLKNEINKNT